MLDTRSKIYRPFCGSLYRPLYQCGGGVSGPCKDGLLSWYDGKVTSDKLGYKSRLGQDREYHKAGSMKFDGTAYLTNSNILSSWTVTNSGTAVATVATGKITFTSGSCWDLKVYDAGGTLQMWCPGVTGDGTTAENVLSNDGDGFAVVNAPSDFWQEHTDGGGSNYLNEYGHTVWGNSLGYTNDLTGTYWTKGRSTVTISDGINIVAVTTDNGYHYVRHVIGNTYDNTYVTVAVLLKAGTHHYAGVRAGGAQEQVNLSTGEWINAQSSNTKERKIIPLENEWYKVIVQSVNTITSYEYVGIQPTDSNGNSYWQPTTEDYFYFKNIALYPGFNISEIEDLDILTIEDYKIIEGFQPASQGDSSKDWRGNTLQYSGSAGIPLYIETAPIFVGDGVVTAENISNAGASITSQTGTATATIDASGTISFPSGDYEEIVLSNGSHYSFTEGTNSDPSTTVFDRNHNGNHLTLINSSSSNWALKERESYPLLDGFTKDSGILIPASVSDTTTDSLDDPLQYKPTETMNSDNPMTFVAAYSKPWINAELSSGNNFFFDGAGGRNSLTWSDIVANYNDMYFYESPNKLVIYDQAIDGSCLNKTLKYTGQTELDFIVDDNGDYVTDDNGVYIYV